VLKFVITALFLVQSALVYAQAYTASEEGHNFQSKISPDTLIKHIRILASDDFEGREAGTKGGELAASYIQNYFK